MIKPGVLRLEAEMLCGGVAVASAEALWVLSGTSCGHSWPAVKRGTSLHWPSQLQRRLGVKIRVTASA